MDKNGFEGFSLHSDVTHMKRTKIEEKARKSRIINERIQ
jgi:hypothetical protein